MKWCLGADRRNPDRHGGAFIPPAAPSGSHSRHDPSIYTRARGGGGGGRQREEGEEERLHGQVLLHMPGGDGWGKPQGDSAQSQTG